MFARGKTTEPSPRLPERRLFGVNALKEKAIEAIRKLPDDCTVDDIMYEVYFVAQVTEGMKEADQGLLIDHEKIQAEIKSWQK